MEGRYGGGTVVGGGEHLPYHLQVLIGFPSVNFSSNCEKLQLPFTHEKTLTCGECAFTHTGQPLTCGECVPH